MWGLVSARVFAAVHFWPYGLKVNPGTVCGEKDPKVYQVTTV